ncbi:hypothetical protein CMK21_19535 [Candidatus Poribacteria bacterium]|nr:hypothetical protein [Candidatus Poribacteria bacterium]
MTCSWLPMAHDAIQRFPSWQTVYYHCHKWYKEDGTKKKDANMLDNQATCQLFRISRLLV